jgi:sarcosine oxidase delta subunit
MGLYDTIKDRLFCPFCGKLQDEMSFQTKDLGKMMREWNLESIRQTMSVQWREDTKICSQCPFCGKQIILIIKGEKEERLRKEKPKRE